MKEKSISILYIKPCRLHKIISQAPPKAREEKGAS